MLDLSGSSVIAYDPRDWYWQREDGTAYASKRGETVPASDAEFAAWRAAGGYPTPYPRDFSGAESEAFLADVLAPYGMKLAGYAAVPTSVTSAQAKIQCLRTPGSKAGSTLLDDITAAVEAAGGEAKIWFTEARTWERSNPYVANLSAGLHLTATQVDQLFAAAAQIAA